MTQALAAIVIAAMLHLTKPSYLRKLFARSHWSFANTLIVIAGELTLGVLQGIALGVVLSLLTLIYLTSHPKGDELGQLPALSQCAAASRGRNISGTADLASGR
ncbi:hypothetical protein Q3C01_16820 [Bradyrhizobium sp. UFLA05-109]